MTVSVNDDYWFRLCSALDDLRSQLRNDHADTGPE